MTKTNPYKLTIYAFIYIMNFYYIRFYIDTCTLYSANELNVSIYNYPSSTQLIQERLNKYIYNLQYNFQCIQ